MEQNGTKKFKNIFNRVYFSSCFICLILGLLGGGILKKDISRHEKLLVALPSTLYAVVDYEFNIYFDNIVEGDACDYNFDIDCNIGAQYERFYRLIPNNEMVGDHLFTITIYKDGSIVDEKTCILKVAGRNEGQEVSNKVLIIGDSTTVSDQEKNGRLEYGQMGTKLLENFRNDVMKIEFLGTQGTFPYIHEGYSGWTTENFFQADSPFVFNEVFDFSEYMKRNNYVNVDYVFINLGINDLFQWDGDKEVKEGILKTICYYKEMVDSIHSYDSDINIGICLTIPPGDSQDAFGEMYGTLISRWEYKNYYIMWVKALIDSFDNNQMNHLYLVPINTNLDTKYNMGVAEAQVNARNPRLEERIVANGNCHPDETGYAQIADVYFYFLKYMERD